MVVVDFHTEPVPRSAFLTQWFRSIPHLLLTGALTPVAVVLGIVSGVAILVTGRPPHSIAAVQATILCGRVRAYSAFFALRPGAGPLPLRPSLVDPGDDPHARVDVVVPDRIGRLSALTRPFRVLPHLAVLVPIAVVLDACYPLWIALAFLNGGWPAGVADLLVRVERWVGSVIAYLAFLQIEPPAWGLRPYGTEPAVADPSAR